MNARPIFWGLAFSLPLWGVLAAAMYLAVLR